MIKEQTYQHKCLRCGHSWESRLVRPKVCPRCKSYVFDQPRKRDAK